MRAVFWRTAAGAAATATFLSASPARTQTPPPLVTLAPPPPAEAVPIDPSSPLAPMPGIDLPWPDLSAPDTAPSDVPATAKAGATSDAETSHPYRVTLAGVEGLGAGFREQFASLSALESSRDKTANAAQIDRRVSQDEGLIQQLLRSSGYYDGTVASRVELVEGVVRVTLTVTAARPYRFATIALPGLEAAGSRARELAGDFAVKAGDPVDAAHVQTEVLAYRARLGHEGYPFAKVGDPEVTADHTAGNATLTLPVDPGAAATFGKIISSGKKPVFTAHHIADIARFREGRPYDAARLDDLRRALIQTSLVSVATIRPVPTADPGIVDIDVQTEPAPPRTIAGELGYGTGEGARAEVSWQHRNLLPPEGAVTFRAIGGTREQLLSASLRRSNFHARDRILNAQIAASHTNLDAYDARTFSISASLERQTNIIWQKKWVWSAGTEFVASDERDTIQATGQPRRQTYIVAALPGTLAYDGTDDLLNPTRGYRLSGRISPEASLLGGFDGYVKTQIDASAYWPATKGIVLAGRVRAASIYGTTTESIAPSRRLYSGGGGSVRGYGYQKIGPVDVNGDPVGGRGLAEFGAEIRIRFGNFGIVPFFDGGSLSQHSLPTFQTMRYGTGLGARYYSSFGPIRIDVGTPLDRRTGESRVAVYVSLGQAF